MQINEGGGMGRVALWARRWDSAPVSPVSLASRTTTASETEPDFPAVQRVFGPGPGLADQLPPDIAALWRGNRLAPIGDYKLC